MATMSLAVHFFMSQFRQYSRSRGEEYLSQMERFVTENKDKRLELKQPAGAVLRISELEGTVYKGKTDVVNGWGKFYLPQIVKMQVLGVVEGTSCTCDQLVVMTCEDKKLYAYDGEELHVVASSLEELCAKGMEYPASKTYYNGEAFEDMTLDDWAEVRKGAVGQTLEREYQEVVKATKPTIMKCLKSTGHT